MKPKGRAVVCLLLGLSLFAGLGSGGRSLPQTEKEQQREENEDYFKKWLNETALYIISEEERAAFESLSTPEEKEHFIEQFWYRRDPDKRTAVNEFREEHYRRIAYANESFTAGWPGWRTDRGKVYIIHGPPDEIEELPSGGHYERELHEGGGSTSVYPYQKWRYRYIEGIGSDVELEFVDRDFSGIYRLALSPGEKDAFLFVPNAGFTLAEELGLASRLQRPYFAPHATYPLMNYREKDSAFARYETFVNIQRPAELKYHDLKELIQVEISYQQLPFSTRVDVFRLNEDKFLAPITMEIENKELTFQPTGGVPQAKVAIYGLVTTITNRLVTEFEDEVTAAFAEADLPRGLQLRSAYNRVLLLDLGSRYKLQLVMKDLSSGKVGTEATAILPPIAPLERLTISPLVVSGYIAPVEDPSDPDQMFVLGNVRVRPSLKKEFSPRAYFAVYLQLYNVAVDESTKNPSFHIRYRILRGGETRVEIEDEVGESVQYFSPQRMVLIKRLPLDDLEAGEYEVEVAFTDRIRNQLVTARDTFHVTPRQ